MTRHIVSNVQSIKGKLATFIVKLFNTEPISAPFDTGAICSWISSPLFDEISKKVTMIQNAFKSRSGRWNDPRFKRFSKIFDQNKY